MSMCWGHQSLRQSLVHIGQCLPNKSHPVTYDTVQTLPEQRQMFMQECSMSLELPLTISFSPSRLLFYQSVCLLQNGEGTHLICPASSIGVFYAYVEYYALRFFEFCGIA